MPFGPVAMPWSGQALVPLDADRMDPHLDDRLTRTVLDALDARVVLLDHAGRIVAVNRAWERFALDQGCAEPDLVGRHYLDVGDDGCGDETTREVAAGITAVLAGSRESYVAEYPCTMASGTRWFGLDVRPLPGANGGAIVTHTEVTAARTARAQVDHQERRFASLIRHAVDLITVVDLNGTITYQSPAVEQVLAYPVDEVVGTNGFEILHPDDIPIAREALSEIATIPYGTTCRELRMRHANGSWRWLEATLTNLLDDPDVCGVVVNSRDITERRMAADMVAERAESFSTLFHGTAEAMIVHDGARFVAVNRAYADLVGVDAGDLVGRAIFDYVAPEDHGLARAQIGQGTEVPYDLIARRADGSTFPAELMGRRIRYQDRWLRLLSVRDVTEHREAALALRASEARFRALVQESSEIVIVFDADGGLRYGNPALERMLGHPIESYAAGLRLDIVHPDDQETVTRAWAAALDAAGAQVRVTYRARRADGAWVWLEGIGTNLLDVPAVAGIVLNLRDVTEQKRLESELRHLALHDPLTGLPNRTLLTERMDGALRQAAEGGGQVGILFLDLDYFKHVNDAFGHAAGDILLHAVAARLRSVLHASDTLARVGGDEFVALLPSIRHERDAQTVADRLQVAMAEPFTWHGRDVMIGVTIGIALGDRGQTHSDILLRDGDTALYSAKRAGRGRSIVFAAGMAGNAARQRTLETDLREAAAHGEFLLHYQPIVDLESGAIRMVEALIRWQHPRYGLVPADEFIPLAEASGHIVPIGRWVLGEVCRQSAAWGPAAPVIAVNLSAAQFIDPTLVRHIATGVMKNDIDPGRLRVEITEHMLIEDMVATAATLGRLRDLGVRVAIDDFGTGYSSLRYLRDLPVDAIKLDRSFVHGLESSAGALAIVEGITSLAHAIGLSVTAEGIETEEQLAHLRAIGCDRGQGYLLGRPVPAGAVVPGRAAWVPEPPPTS